MLRHVPDAGGMASADLRGDKAKLDIFAFHIRPDAHFLQRDIRRCTDGPDILKRLVLLHGTAAFPGRERSLPVFVFRGNRFQLQRPACPCLKSLHRCRIPRFASLNLDPVRLPVLVIGILPEPVSEGFAQQLLHGCMIDARTDDNVPARFLKECIRRCLKRTFRNCVRERKTELDFLAFGIQSRLCKRKGLKTQLHQILDLLLIQFMGGLCLFRFFLRHRTEQKQAEGIHFKVRRFLKHTLP